MNTLELPERTIKESILNEPAPSSLSFLRRPMIQRRRAVTPPSSAEPSDRDLHLGSRGQEGKISAAAAIFSSERRLLAFCLVFRAVNALLVQTYFNPDEHWQALEVAHRVAFGYGHLTWEWREGIRSYLHPLLFALLYKVMAFLRLDSPWFMRTRAHVISYTPFIRPFFGDVRSLAGFNQKLLFKMKAPRLLQSVFSAFGDLYLYKLSQLIFDENVARWALFSQLVNWFMFFCITRTLSNSLEAVLTVVALFYWLSFRYSSKQVPVGSRKLALLIAALACAVRPTSAITWLFIGALDLFQVQGRLTFLFLDIVPIGILVLAFMFFLDWWMYGSWIFVPLNFLKFNFLSSGGDYYGTHKWHWYFTQGFSAMLFTFLPFTIIGILKSKEWKLSSLVAWVLGVYSILGHKEFRFVLPVLPVALMFSGYTIAFMGKADSEDIKAKASIRHARCPSKMHLAILFLVITNLPMALYMSLVHQRGSEDVMYYLSKEARVGKVKSIIFLMPCHSTPYYSALHSNLPMRFLDCSPSDSKDILDESDRFMMDPFGFVSGTLKNSSLLASHVVLFDSQEKHLAELLISNSYREVKRFFHAHFKVDRDLQAAVVVYARTAP